MCTAIGKKPVTSTACAMSGVRREEVMSREGKCDCVYGYGGDACDMACTREECGNHGECVSGGYCVCDAGYEGEMCEKKESGYGVVIAILLAANCVVAYLWYRARVSCVLSAVHSFVCSLFVCSLFVCSLSVHCLFIVCSLSRVFSIHCILIHCILIHCILIHCILTAYSPLPERRRLRTQAVSSSPLSHV